MLTAKRQNNIAMGKYNVGYHDTDKQPLDGVATLTHDPVAIDNLRHEQSGQVLDELERLWKDAAKGIEEVKRTILEATGVPKEAFEK